VIPYYTLWFGGCSSPLSLGAGQIYSRIFWQYWATASKNSNSLGKTKNEIGSIPKTHPTLFYTIPIGICGFLGFLYLGSEMTQRISRGDNCEICVESCENSRETWVSPWLMIYLRWLGGWRREKGLFFHCGLCSTPHSLWSMVFLSWDFVNRLHKGWNSCFFLP